MAFVTFPALQLHYFCTTLVGPGVSKVEKNRVTTPGPRGVQLARITAPDTWQNFTNLTPIKRGRPNPSTQRLNLDAGGARG